MIIITLATSILSVTFITLNRYLAIIWKINITRFQAQMMIASTWVTIVLVTTLYNSNKELSENSLALQTSYTYCFLDFSSRDPIVIIALITILIFMSIPLLFMIFAYSQIILYYKDMNRKKRKTKSEVVFCVCRGI